MHNPRLHLERRSIDARLPLLALAASLLLGCPDDKRASTATTSSAAAAPALSASPGASAPPASASASAIVHQPGTVPALPGAHKGAGAPAATAPAAAAPEPTFAALAALEKSRSVDASAPTARWLGRGSTLGVLLAHGVLVVDVAKGAGFTLTTHAEPTGLSLSGDDAELAVSDGSGRVTLWDTRKGTLIRSFPLGGDSLALSPDGSTLVVGGQGLLAWDARSGAELIHLPDVQAYDFGFAEGGQEIVAASSTEVVTYDRSGKVKPGGGGAQTGGTFATIVSPNGRFAAASAPDGHGLQVFEVHAWRARQLVVIESCDEHVWPHFSQNGRLIFAKGGGRWVKGFETGSFKPYASYHATAGRELVSFADDLTRVVVTRGGVDAAVVVVETKAETRLEKAFTEEALYAFSADGRYLSGSAGKTLRIWDAKTAKVLHEIQG